MSNSPLDTVKTKPRPTPLYTSEALETELANIDHKQYRVSVRDELFLMAYLNPEKETYMNATKSLMSVAAGMSYDTAGVISYQTLKRLRKSGYLNMLIEVLGGGIEVRVHRLAAIASGKASRQIITVDDKGKRKIQTIPPTFTESLGAIKELNIIDGTRSRGEIAKRVMSDTYKAFSKALSKSVTDKGKIDALTANKRARTNETPEDEGITVDTESVDPEQDIEGADSIESEDDDSFEQDQEDSPMNSDISTTGND